MFSVIFPGQGSQMVGMGKELLTNYESVKKLFSEANDILDFSITDLILNGPKEKLDLTENTQPAIFLISYSIFNVIKNEHGIKLNNAKYFAGHSLGEYTALAASEALNFSETLKILKLRGKAMQSAVPEGEGGMLAVLGSDIEKVEKDIKKFDCEIANDNSNGQIVVSGKVNQLNNLALELKNKSIKNIKLPVSAPFHCKLMKKATEIMKDELNKINFKQSKNELISNVTAREVSEPNEIKKLLIQQIESRVRWRESIIYMISKGIHEFVEIGPGKVLSGLIKRIDKNVKVSTINNEEDITKLNIND
tara:strand:- start:739 stop:1659 length:921 start_codon:yes stop_codon:yes gene_type:complete